jgi:AICAR transformylase/IMP cyclohydrolase PurH
MMEGMNLKYGCNPNQRQAALLMAAGQGAQRGNRSSERHIV